MDMSGLFQEFLLLSSSSSLLSFPKEKGHQGLLLTAVVVLGSTK